MEEKIKTSSRRIIFLNLISSINYWVGSWTFLVIHVIWFAVWLAWKIDINLLTMIVSLEAIILMILLLMAQNRQSTSDNIRDEADYQADLRSMKASENILLQIKEIKKEIKEFKKQSNDFKIE